VAKTLKRLRYPLEVTLLCVRRNVACSLSLHDLEEIMIDRGILEDHSTVHRWVIKLVPLLEKTFRKRKRPAGRSWRIHKTYIKIRGQSRQLYRTADSQSGRASRPQC
jgi:putative transposase